MYINASLKVSHPISTLNEVNASFGGKQVVITMKDYDEMRKRYLAGENQRHIWNSMKLCLSVVKSMKHAGSRANRILSGSCTIWKKDPSIPCRGIRLKQPNAPVSR